MPADILIIDDHFIPQSRGAETARSLAWELRIEKTGNNPIPVLGRRASEFFQALVIMFHERGKPFDGTILDVIFQGEEYGGIELCIALERAGLLRNLGPLLVSTNSKDDDHKIDSFASKYAGGRVYYDKNHDKFSSQHLCAFLALIPNAVQC